MRIDPANPQRFSSRGAINFSERSPYSRPYMIGVPLRKPIPPVIHFVAGQPYVKNVPLPTNHKTAQEYILNPATVPDSKTDAQPSFQAGNYGDAGTFSVNLVAGVPQLVLKRPAKTRVLLLAQNLNAIGVAAYAFDGTPSIAASINIAAGGNRLWDSAVPQGDFYMISNAAVVVAIEFINKDLTNPNT